MKKYLFEGGDAFSLEDLTQFEQDFLDGALRPTLKSEDDKPSHMKNPVKVITGKSFEEEVVNSDKDVLVEFYAPWCGHCKALAPKWQDLAERLEAVESVMIAKMDATQNEIDHEQVALSGFPTIYFFPSDGGEPMKYQGSREVDGLLEFLTQHATKPFTLGAKESGDEVTAKDEL